MNSKQSGIYSITSKINGKRYIGSANRICTRWSEHKGDLRDNKHHSPQLQNHYNKYGKDDLIFSVVEIIEKGDLDILDFKNLLIKREQIYLNNWEECQFNCVKIAGSTLGHKRPNTKYYHYDKKSNLYKTYYLVDNKRKTINSHFLEEDAIKEVELLKSLSEQEIIKYYKESREKPPKKRRGVKDYFFKTREQKWFVSIRINNKVKYFGCYKTEEEAIKQVEYINTLSTEDKIKYSDSKSYPRVDKRIPNSKYYSFNKATNKWMIQIKINKKMKTFNFKTEQEAINKVKELKIEAGIE